GFQPSEAVVDERARLNSADDSSELVENVILVSRNDVQAAGIVLLGNRDDPPQLVVRVLLLPVLAVGDRYIPPRIGIRHRRRSTDRKGASERVVRIVRRTGGASCPVRGSA